MAVRRFVARALDGFLLFLPVSLPFLYVLPDGISWMFVLVGCFAAEASCIWKWGATPGKFIMGMRVVGAPQAITFNAALKRSIQVWVLGEALGLGTILPHAAMAGAYRRYMDTGATLWDDKCGTDVISTRPIREGWLW